MVSKKKASGRVTRSGRQIARSTDEEPSTNIGRGNPKERSSSVDTAEEENEFSPSSDLAMMIKDRLGEGDPGELGEPDSLVKLKKLKVKLKRPASTMKSKVTVKTVKPVAKKHKPAKAKAVELVGEGNTPSNLVEMEIPKRKSSKAYYEAKKTPKSFNLGETQAIGAETTSDSSGDDGIEEVDVIDQTIENQDKLVGKLGYEPDLDALSDDDRRNLAYRKYRLKKGQSFGKRATSDDSLDYGAGAEPTQIEKTVSSVRNAASNDDLYKEVTRKLNDPTSANAAGSLIEKNVMERDLLEFDSLNPQEQRKAFAKVRVQLERARIEKNKTLFALRSKSAENQSRFLPGSELWPEKVGGREGLDMEAARLVTNVNVSMFDAIQPSDPNAEELKRYVVINYINSQAVSTYLPTLASEVNSHKEELQEEIEKRRFRNREIHQMMGDARNHVHSFRADMDKKMVDSKVYIDTLRAEISSLREAVSENSLRSEIDALKEVVSQNTNRISVPVAATARVNHILPKVDVLETLDMKKLGQWLNVVGEVMNLDPGFEPRRFVHSSLIEKFCRNEGDRDVVYFSVKEYYEKGKAENRQDPMRLLKEVKYPASGDNRERFQTYMMNVSSKIEEGYAERLGEEALVELSFEITKKVPSSFGLSKEAIRSKVRNFKDPLWSVEMLQSLLEAQRQFALDRGVDASKGQVPESGSKSRDKKPRTPSMNRVFTPSVNKVSSFVPFPMAVGHMPVNLTGASMDVLNKEKEFHQKWHSEIPWTHHRSCAYCKRHGHGMHDCVTFPVNLLKKDDDRKLKSVQGDVLKTRQVQDFINRTFRRQMENPSGKTNYHMPKGLTSLKHSVIVKARMMMGGKESANDSDPQSGFKGSNVLALAAPPRQKELEDMKAMVPEGYDLMIEGTKEYPTLEVHVGEVSQFRDFAENYEICTNNGKVIGDAKFDSGAKVTVGSWWKHKDLLESYSSASGNFHVANDAPVKILAVGYVGLVVRVNGVESRACPRAKVILVNSQDWPSFLIGRPELRKMGLDPAQNLGLG
eukprot:snap_masked-scaffold_3-processed-gene-18.17-mRNA-1 protein AED:1.00 eAED:1.00 QI:0/-1/0/0/-1/1/1/0/1035